MGVIITRYVQEFRYWHKADMLNALTKVRFWGWRGLVSMSANDPKRTLPLALSSASEDRCGWPLSGVRNSC